MKKLIKKFSIGKTGINIGIAFYLNKNKKMFVLFNFAIGYDVPVSNFSNKKRFYLNINPPQFSKEGMILFGVNIN